MEKLVSGIDEAGRGSIFGPLIIVGLSMCESDLKALEKKGLKDSKLFTGLIGRKKRDELALEIKGLAPDRIIKEVPSDVIDRTLAKRPSDNLNLLEIRIFYKLIKELKPNKIYIDNLSSPKYTVNEIRKLIHSSNDSHKLVINSRKNDEYSIFLFKDNRSKKEVVISTRADKKYPIVAAASILAKHTRDKRLREIERKFKLSTLCLGQGYPNKNDTNVVKFLENYQKEIKARSFPFIRYNWEWATLQDILKKSEKTLDDFF